MQHFTSTVILIVVPSAMHAAKEALQMSGWSARSDKERDRAGVAIGSGIGDAMWVVGCGVIAQVAVEIGDGSQPRLMKELRATDRFRVFSVADPNFSGIVVRLGLLLVGESVGLVRPAWRRPAVCGEFCRCCRLWLRLLPLLPKFAALS